MDVPNTRHTALEYGAVLLDSQSGWLLAATFTDSYFDDANREYLDEWFRRLGYADQRVFEPVYEDFVTNLFIEPDSDALRAFDKEFVKSGAWQKLALCEATLEMVMEEPSHAWWDDAGFSERVHLLTRASLDIDCAVGTFPPAGVGYQLAHDWME